MGDLTRASWFWRCTVGLLILYCTVIFGYTVYAFWLVPGGMDFTTFLQMILPLFIINMLTFVSMLTRPDMCFVNDKMKHVTFKRSLPTYIASQGSYFQKLHKALLRYQTGDPKYLNDMVYEDEQRKAWLDEVFSSESKDHGAGA